MRLHEAGKTGKDLTSIQDGSAVSSPRNASLSGLGKAGRLRLGVTFKGQSALQNQRGFMQSHSPAVDFHRSKRYDERMKSRSPRPPGPAIGTRKYGSTSAGAKRATTGDGSATRVKMTGLYPIAQYRDMLRDMLNYFEAQGITHINGLWNYVNLADAKGKPIRLKNADDPLVFNGPYPVAADEYKAP
jgi:hypothetical protein